MYNQDTAIIVSATNNSTLKKLKNRKKNIQIYMSSNNGWSKSASTKGVKPRAQAACRPGWLWMQPNTKSQIYLKPPFCLSVLVSVCVFNVWPKTTLLLPMWPRDAKRLDTPECPQSRALAIFVFVIK